MKLALLGSDYESVSLTTAATAQNCQIVWCGDVGWARESFDLAWLPDQDQGQQWEALLDNQLCDGVIVGRGEAAEAFRAEQVGRLVKNGVTLLTTFPLVDSVLSYYEIDMAREESRSLLRHFNPLVEQQEFLQQCATWTRNEHEQLGHVEQLVWERPLADRSQLQVLRHFARDVELLSKVAGKIDRLAALGSPDQTATYTGLSVQMLGKQNLPVHWTVGPVQHHEHPQLQLVAQQGRIVVQFDELGRAVQWEVQQAGDCHSTPLQSADPAATAIRMLVEAIQIGGGQKSTWTAALRAMELTDTIEISLRRRRMIEVHPQQLSEELAFKGTMSAAGCGVLLILPTLLLLFGWLAGLFGLSVAHYWPHCLVALLAAFLAVQLLPKLLLNKRPGGDQNDR